MDAPKQGDKVLVYRKGAFRITEGTVVTILRHDIQVVFESDDSDSVQLRFKSKEFNTICTWFHRYPDTTCYVAMLPATDKESYLYIATSMEVKDAFDSLFELLEGLKDEL